MLEHFELVASKKMDTDSTVPILSGDFLTAVLKRAAASPWGKPFESSPNTPSVRLPYYLGGDLKFARLEGSGDEAEVRISRARCQGW